MISIRQQRYGLDVAFYNECTLEDFKQFEEALLKRAEEQLRPDILLDMTEMRDFTIDMALEELRFVRAHERDFGHIAIVVEDIWIKLGIRISELLSHTRVEYFKTLDEAKIWLNGFA